MYARGNDRARIYLDDFDGSAYLGLLERVIARREWRCLSYCLMDNHVHLLLETPHPNLGAGMQELHGSYAQYFNARHGRVGHVFQGRYGAVRVMSDEQLWTVAGYIAENPVEAGMVLRPGDWRWSSHPAVVGGVAPGWLDVRRLMEYFSCAGGDPLERYVAFVDQRPAG